MGELPATPGSVAPATVRREEPTVLGPVWPAVPLEDDAPDTDLFHEQQLLGWLVADSHAWRDALRELPLVGTRFLDFDLIEELGRGAFGRVFLARQDELAGRLVAIKVSVSLSDEAAHLARLQHPNIVPIYSAHHAGVLHAVVMPFISRTTLSDLNHALRDSQSRPGSGRDLLTTLRSLQTRPVGSTVSAIGESLPEAEPEPAARLDHLARADYVGAVLEIGAGLAAGLAHAHERGILHRDLKPGNVLITADGRPLILDFHLAEDLTQRGHAPKAKPAGTPAYMAPEQLRALGDAQLPPPDGRADVYAAGLILYQMLTGNHPFPRRRGPLAEVLPAMLADRSAALTDPRSWNAAVTPAVASIVRTCLAFDPAQRYPSAAALLDDLERQRDHRPLRHAPEPSWRERARKFTRRHPRLASPAVLAAALAAVVLVAAAVGYGMKQRAYTREADAARAQFDRFDGNYRQAERALTAGDAQLRQAGIKRGLSALADWGVLADPDWANGSVAARLTPSERDRLRTKAGTLAYLLARAVHLRPGGQGNAAELEQRAHELLPERSAFLTAAELQGSGRIRESRAVLLDLTKQQPDEANAWFLLGRAEQLLGHDQAAFDAYSTCITLQPDDGLAYCNRAAVNLARHDWRQALADAGRAVQLAPDLPAALLLRAQVREKLGQLPAARRDLDELLSWPDAPPRAWFTRAVVHERLGDKTAAAADTARGLAADAPEVADLVARGYARLKTDPAAARADFEAAEKLDPFAPEPLVNQAYLDGEVFAKPDRALAHLDRLLAQRPEYLPALCPRAVYLARLGRDSAAASAAERALQVSNTPYAQYRAACAYALISPRQPERAATALALLAAALKSGYGYDYLPSDADLDPLRHLPDFRQLLDSARHLRGLRAAGRSD